MNPIRTLALFALLSIVIAPCARAADTGTVAGRVVDHKTGHAIPFASVAIVGAQRGGLTDSEGQFSVSGIPPGTYEVKVQFLGYRPGGATGVVVAAGKVVTLNVALDDIVVREEKAIEVSAERRLVETKQGATVRSVGASEIRNLPVTTVGDVLQQQAGVSTDADQIHIRGGRADETIFVVNGVANRDLVTGQSTAGQLNARSVEEVSVATGAYDVRYGNALSGVVEIKLKEGTEKFQGGATAQTGSYGMRNWQVVASGPDRIFAPLARAIGLGPAGSVTSVLDVSSSLFETRFRYLHFKDLNGHDPNLIEGTVLPPARERIHSGYEDSFLGWRWKYDDSWSPSGDNRWAARYGWFWKPNTRDKVSFNFSKRIAIDQGFSRTSITAQGDVIDPSYPWQWDHRINHAATIFEDNVQSSVEWRRAVSSTGFWNAQVSRYFTAQRRDVLGKWWWQYVEPDDISYFPKTPMADDYFTDSGDDNTWGDRRTSTWAMNFNLTQRIHHNEIEAGIEHQFQSVQYVTIQAPWIDDPNGLGQFHDLWLVHPWVGDLYARDKIEYEGFVANIGMRADYWMVGREAEQALADTSRHNIAASTRSQFYADTRSFFGRRTKVHFSPRMIVAHPITENSSFFFNYGEFTQIPSYRYVYSKLNSISSEAYPYQGNPDLNPQISVNYEVGAKHQFLPTAATNVTFFVRDIYDYLSATRVDPTSGSNIASYFLYLNGHFARSKGFEIELEKRRSHHWSGKISYTYTQTKGKSSDPNEDKALQELGGVSDQRLSQVFMSWNRPHKLSASLDVRFDKDTPRGLGLLRRTGINVYVEGQSGRAYTPYDSTDSRPAGLPASKNAPIQFTTDLKLSRTLSLFSRRVDLSVQGQNIFNNYLYYNIDRITGQGRVWGSGEFDPARVPGLTYKDDFVGKVSDPSNYGAGAQWRMQLDYDF